MEFSVREMDEVKDIGKVFALFGILHQEHADMFAARGVRMNPPSFAIEDYNIDIIECDGEVAGLVATGRSMAFAEMGTIADIVLYPQYRGAGIGEAVLSKVFDEMRDNGLKSANLNVMADNRAVDFYKRLGFEVRSLFMVKTL